MLFHTMVAPFRKGSSFAKWHQRLQFMFIANGFEEERQKAHFITLIGEYGFDVLSKTFFNQDLNEVPLAIMVDRLKQTLDKTPSDTCQRTAFGRRVQQAGETAEDFLVALKLQAELCNYPQDFKETALLDRILSGLKEPALLQQIHLQEQLTLAKAERIIQTWVVASNNTKAIAEAEATVAHP